MTKWERWIPGWLRVKYLERNLGRMAMEIDLLKGEIEARRRALEAIVRQYIQACQQLNRVERRAARWKRKARALHRANRLLREDLKDSYTTGCLDASEMKDVNF